MFFSVNKFGEMVLSVNKINNFILFICFFSMGFLIFKLTILMFVFYFILNSEKIFKKKLAVPEFVVFIILLFLTILFYLISKVNGYYLDNIDKTEPIAVITFCLVGGLIFILSDFNEKKNIVISLIAGYGFYCLFVVAYNFYILDIASVYANVYNPFSQSYENSPKFANLLILFSILIFYSFKELDKFFLKILMIILFLFTFHMGIVTGSRSFLLVNFLFLLYFIIKSNKKYLLFFLSLIFPFVFIFFSNFDYEDFVVFQRLSEDGLESSRWDLYSAATTQIINHPFGGGLIDKNIFGTSWYHNFFLDIGRMSGIFPLICFAFIYGICLIRAFNSDDLFLKIMFFSCFLIMQQDVIFSGIYGIFIISFFLCILLFSQKNIPDLEETRF